MPWYRRDSFCIWKRGWNSSKKVSEQEIWSITKNSLLIGRCVLWAQKSTAEYWHFLCLVKVGRFRRLLIAGPTIFQILVRSNKFIRIFLSKWILLENLKMSLTKPRQADFKESHIPLKSPATLSPDRPWSHGFSSISSVSRRNLILLGWVKYSLTLTLSLPWGFNFCCV